MEIVRYLIMERSQDFFFPDEADRLKNHSLGLYFQHIIGLISTEEIVMADKIKLPVV
jgi:hypothetical protein